MTDIPQQATLANDESHLISQAKAGNYSAFEELVNRYEKKIYRLGMNITGNREDAEDVLQDAFLKAFEHLPDFREDSRFYTWIVRIAVNEALMKLRKRRTSREVPWTTRKTKTAKWWCASLPIGSPTRSSNLPERKWNGFFQAR